MPTWAKFIKGGGPAQDLIRVEAIVAVVRLVPALSPATVAPEIILRLSRERVRGT
jgi:hypothetical protein